MGAEDLDPVDLPDLLGTKPLDFDVIDFDQFGPQPPDLPLGDNLDNEELEMKVNQYGGIENSNGEKGAGESTEAMKPEEQITDMDLDTADNGVEQGLSSYFSLRSQDLRESLAPCQGISDRVVWCFATDTLLSLIRC